MDSSAKISLRARASIHARSTQRILDVDLFQPTHDSIAYFCPRVVPGGIIICDDYNTVSCPGVKKAVDDSFPDKPEKVANRRL